MRIQIYTVSRALCSLDCIYYCSRYTHSILPYSELSLYKLVELRARERQEIQHLCNTTKKLIPLEVKLSKEEVS